jgi:anaerobic ribonucleoside-triphosphate reductase/predicted transcriptional regulator
LSRSRRLRGVKVLKAVSSTVRLRILDLLFETGALSYTELMSTLKMNPSRDAGRFAYHLKFLLKADLIEPDVKTKKYRLTELGKMIVGVTEEIEKKASKPKRMLVRTSGFALEEFDRSKIADSLIKEANVPADLAQKVARETERRLLKSKTKYLTAPLIREVVNAILIEKGLEEYRHKLTRLGLPVHDVTKILKAKGEALQEKVNVCERTGKAILKEYMLLNMLPRDIADAHLSGSIHLTNLSHWILKPSEIAHDLRFFFQKGLNFEKINSLKHSYPPPKDLESALSTAFTVLLCSAEEVSGEQTLNYFNVFLAPFVRGMNRSEVKEALHLFVSNLNTHVNTVSLGLELAIPDFIAEKQAFGCFGRTVGNYGDFLKESQLIASLLLEVLRDESAHKPLLNPRPVMKIRPEILRDEQAGMLLLQAHLFAAEKGIPHFAICTGKNQHGVFSATGCRLAADFRGDWEIDTLRTGCAGNVAVNLPRVAYEAEKDEVKFFEILRERIEMAVRALDIKYHALKQRGKDLLPFLMQDVDGDLYFRLENASRLICLVGLNEAVEVFHGKSVYGDEQALVCAEKIMRYVLDFTRKIGKRRGKRLLPAVLPNFKASKRLARLDIERFGVAKIRFLGTREKPFYSTITGLSFQSTEALLKRLKAEQRLRLSCVGGCPTVIELGDAKLEPDELVSLTNRIVNEQGLESFTYNRNLTYCTSCRKSWFGLLHKCPSCGATSTLTSLSQVEPLDIT